MCFFVCISADGLKMLSYRVNVAETTKYENIFQVEGNRVTSLHFSPKGTYLSTWNPYTGVYYFLLKKLLKMYVRVINLEVL